MKYIYFALISLMLIALLPSMGQNLEIIYPKNSSTINAPSTFIVGNTDPNAKLTINNKPVEVFPNGSFVQVIPLNKGENKIEINSQIDKESKNITYTLNVPENKATAQKTACSPSLIPISSIAEIKNDMSTVRTAPNSSRLTPLPKGTILSLNGKLGENYRFKMSETMNGWISGDNIGIISKNPPCVQSEIQAVTMESNPDNVLIKIPLEQKLPINIEELSGAKLALKIYGGTANIDVIHYYDPFIKEIKWVQEDKDTFKLVITPNTSQLWGYDYYYENNTLVLKLKKPPVINPQNPLKDKIITIDPGHGGSETGAIGPTGVPEKNG